MTWMFYCLSAVAFPSHGISSALNSGVFFPPTHDTNKCQSSTFGVFTPSAVFKRWYTWTMLDHGEPHRSLPVFAGGCALSKKKSCSKAGSSPVITSGEAVEVTRPSIPPSIHPFSVTVCATWSWVEPQLSKREDQIQSATKVTTNKALTLLVGWWHSLQEGPPKVVSTFSV